MLRFHLAAMVCLGAVTGLSALCVAQPRSQRPPEPEVQVPEYLRYPRGFVSKPGSRGLIFTQIPLVMDVREWDQFADVLKLSGAQRKAIDAAYDQYRRDDWDYRLKNAQPLFDRSGPLSMGPMDQTPDDAAQILQEDIRQHESIM